MSTQQKFRGVYPPIITPFGSNEEVNEEGLREHIDWLIEEGVDGIIPTGSTGRYPSLSDEERKKVVEVTIDQVNNRVPVVVGTGADSTKLAVRWTKHAKDAGADGVMIAAPYYCLPDEEGIYKHYRTIAEAVDIPIMIYNNPFSTGIDIPPQLIARLAEIDNILYVKEASADPRRVHEIIRLAGDKITVFCGWDDTAFEAFVLGAEGWVSGCANFIPKMAKQLFELTVEKKDISRARDLYYKMLPLLAFTEEKGGMQVEKAALEILGKPRGIPRMPLLPLSEEDKKKLKKMMIDLRVV